jgi:PAS domain S-box-containing protein
MSLASRRPPDPGGRSTGRRDLVIVGLVTVVVFSVGVSDGAFSTWEAWLETHIPSLAPNLFGLLMVLAAAASAFGVLRSRAAQREKLLRAETELRFQALVEQVPAVSYTWDPTVPTGQAAPLYVSPQLEQMLGYRPQEWSSSPMFWIDKLHADDRDRVMAASDEADRTGSPFDEEYRISAKDGRMVWIHDEAVVVAKDDWGNPTLVQGVMYDITRRKEAELLLADAENRYRTLIESLPVVTYVSDATPQGQDILRYVAPTMEQLTGYAPQECTDSAEFWMDVIHPDDRARVLEHSRAVDLTGDPFDAEYRIVRKDGEITWVHDSGVVVERRADAVVWQGVFQDVGRRRQAEDKLREAEERYRTLVEQLPVAVYVDAVDELSTALYISPQYERITGYSAHQRMNDAELWVRMLHPDDRERVIAESIRTNETGDPFDIEYRIIGADGGVVWLHDHAFLATAPDGGRTWQGVLTDITEHKDAEEQLKSTEERFRAIVEHMPSAIYLDVPDSSLRTLYVSPQIEDITGISPADWTSRPEAWLEAIEPADKEAVIERYSWALARRQPWIGEYRVRTRDGRTIWVRDETTFLDSGQDGQAAMLGVISDITERKLAEHALRESEQREREAAERLRALDEMKNTFLAAVSHELRSPLTSILGLSLTLERTRDMPAEDRIDLLERLAANARKLDRLLKDLLDIDRLNRGIVEPQYRPVDVGALARRTVETLDSLTDRKVIVKVESVTVSADPAKVERIVENLLMNAARHTATDRRIWLRVQASEDGALITVEDNGKGVPEEIRDEIFEPFRQGPISSPHSPGTGIGLSLVARFAELHRGRAWVQERTGGGASFRVFLPAEPPAASPPTTGAVAPKAVPKTAASHRAGAPAAKRVTRSNGKAASSRNGRRTAPKPAPGAVQPSG